VGVDTGVLSGRVRIASWQEGCEPVLQVDKRGRFITNMDFADFVVAAVDSDDERIKGSCMVILEAGDPGTYDRGSPTQKLVHQLSSTRDPIFSVQVPADRIVGGYTIVAGAIVPNYNHSQVIEAVFQRTRVTVGAMTAAKLLSAVEPVIRYQRGRFRGGGGAPGTPRHDLGLQVKEDPLHRLVEVWATGEASASLVFAAARLFDEFDPLERQKDEALATRGIQGPRAQFRALRQAQPAALEYLELAARPPEARDAERFAALQQDVLVRFVLTQAEANVLCPACKLWNTGHGANVMREAVSLMGGYGVTEDCPGFLPQKWVDAQLEATYEGPEAVQRRQLSLTMVDELFLAQFRQGAARLQRLAAADPRLGAGTLVAAMELWDWTLQHLLAATDAEGKRLYRDQRQGVTFAMADALCWLLAARAQILDVVELATNGERQLAAADGLAGTVQFLADLCQVQCGQAAGEVGRICAELVYGFREPGPAVAARTAAGGPAGAAGLEEFVCRRCRVDASLAGVRLAKERAAAALTQLMVPEALDYPR